MNADRDALLKLRDAVITAARSLSTLVAQMARVNAAFARAIREAAERSESGWQMIQDRVAPTTPRPGSPPPQPPVGMRSGVMPFVQAETDLERARNDIQSPIYLHPHFAQLRQRFNLEPGEVVTREPDVEVKPLEKKPRRRNLEL